MDPSHPPIFPNPTQRHLHAAHFDAQALQQFRGLGLSQQTRLLVVEAVEDLPQAGHLAVCRTNIHRLDGGDRDGDMGMLGIF